MVAERNTMMSTAEKLGRQIRAARKWAGKSQSWLARQLGVAEFTVRRWERGSCAPGVNTIGRIAEALGVTASWLLTEPR